MSTLYRKYRPQSFADVYGQEHIKQTIQNEIEQDKSAHAYLFCGPRGVGKTTMARLVAKTVNCLNRKDGEFEPCNNCDSCNEIIENKSLDVVEIDAASHTGVDHVREHIINAARFTPNSRKYKVFIIDEVHMLSTAAFNALLKILEEPPSYVKFVLATTEIHKILPTIISRCQRFDFKKISSQDLRNRLQFLVESESKKLDDAVYNIIIKNADGCLRDAESLLGQVLILDESHVTLQQVELILPITNYSLADSFLAALAQKDIKGAITQINEFVQNGVNLEQFTRDFVEYVRKVMLYSIHQEFKDFAFDLDEGLQNQIKHWAAEIQIQDLLKMVDVSITALHELKNAPIIQLPLELAVVALLDKTVEPAKNISTASVVQNSVTQQKVASVRAAEKSIAEVAPTQIEQQVEQKEKIEPVNLVTENTSQEIKVEEHIPVSVEENTTENNIEENSVAENTDFVQEADVSINTILNDWGLIKKKIKESHYTLSCLLSAAVPKEVQGNTLVLACKHKFSIDKIDDVANRGILEQEISKLYQGNMKVKVVHDASISSNLDNNMNISMGEVMSRTQGGLDPAQQQARDAQAAQSSQNNQGQADDGIETVLDLFGAG